MTNQKSASLLQMLEISSKYWKQIMIDFITHLPITKNKNDFIVVFVDQLSKQAHFRAIHCMTTVLEITKLFFKTIFINYRLPTIIISNQNTKFTSYF